MDLLPDSPPTTEYAASASLPRPTLLRNLSFWLLAMLLGFAFLLLLPASDSFFIAGLATILSLAALPLLLLLPWALTAPSVGLRWLRVFTLQSLSLGGLTALTALCHVLAGSSDQRDFGAVASLVGSIYFVAGLLVAVMVYWPWLRRPW